MEYEFIVAGGGLVGSSIAYGLARQKYKVAVLDGGDRSFRASRGNFGLVWVQGKDWDYAPYAQCRAPINYRRLIWNSVIEWQRG